MKNNAFTRKYLSLLLALLLSLSLFGCGKKSAGDTADAAAIDGGMPADEAAPAETGAETAGEASSPSPEGDATATPAPTMMVFANDEERKFYEAYDCIFGTASEKADYSKAVRLMRPLAESGYAQAQYYMGYMYEYGYGVKQDDVVSLDWYVKAAESGSTKSMINLGLMYEYGDGVEQDYSTALAWYKAAANAGDATSTTNIGWMYQNGKGVEPDDSAAFSWYLLGANAGIPTAMRFVGWMYYYGKGVEQSNDNAKFWLQMAVDNGDTAGAYLLKAVDSNMSEVGN